ncbi:hypothetical protein BDV96DRAFT_205358 [Lophiotrema nucula]|uniref:Uncharacterized protein n=1 Tax=Lophiotrema nucula TaxID=690887 RepID=A0A6A5ZPK3_9PLEO|nr:hypothetical protein BDV96DRAFT_205358 [Lophiotrema nucula]
MSLGASSQPTMKSTIFSFLWTSLILVLHFELVHALPDYGQRPLIHLDKAEHTGSKSLPRFQQKPLLHFSEHDQVELETSDGNQKPWAVGFALGPTYGTASIRWANGNYSHVAKIDGNIEYYEAMRFFGSKAAVHPHQPYQFFGEDWVDLPRRLLRKARKAIGLPATKEVGALASMLNDLRTATQWYLEDSVDRAVVARPNLNAIYEEDIFDALEFVDLPYLRICHWSLNNLTAMTERARESSWDDCAVPMAHYAAIAGEGIGMCQNYTDDRACRNEGGEREPEVTLVVDWTMDYLQITWRISKTPYELWGNSEYRFDSVPRYDLGFAGIPESVDDDEWMANLTDYIEKSMRYTPWRHDINHVLFLGDAMRGDENESGIFLYWFIDAALEDKGQKEDPKWYWDCDRDAGDDFRPCGEKDPAFTAANGAAEMAWRWERGLWRCTEREKEEGKCGGELGVDEAGVSQWEAGREYYDQEGRIHVVPGVIYD